MQAIMSKIKGYESWVSLLWHVSGLLDEKAGAIEDGASSLVRIRWFLNSFQPTMLIRDVRTRSFYGVSGGRELVVCLGE